MVAVLSFPVLVGIAPKPGLATMCQVLCSMLDSLTAMRACVCNCFLALNRVDQGSIAASLVSDTMDLTARDPLMTC